MTLINRRETYVEKADIVDVFYDWLYCTEMREFCNRTVVAISTLPVFEDCFQNLL